jgi:hypothetical protein
LSYVKGSMGPLHDDGGPIAPTRRRPSMTEYKEYVAWDAPTRWFHWINALAVVGLIGTGLIILFDNALGLSASGKVTLKSVHALFGYVMALNLLWRFAWAFFGGRYARWRAIVPAGAGYLAAPVLYRFVPFGRAAAVRWAQSTRAHRRIPALPPPARSGGHGSCHRGHRPILAALRALVCDLGSRSWDRPCEHCSRRQGADRPSLLRFNACVPPAIR